MQIESDEDGVVAADVGGYCSGLHLQPLEGSAVVLLHWKRLGWEVLAERQKSVSLDSAVEVVAKSQM